MSEPIRDYNSECHQCEFSMGLAKERLDELTQLRAQIRERNETIRLLEDRQSETLKKVWEALGISTYDEAKPLSMFEHIEQLRARVKELEERLADQASLTDAFRVSEANFDEACDKLKARIRELEEAMPKPEELRTMADEFDDGYFTFSAPFRRMADRIEKVMRKEGNE